jgi:hypothetical protein
LRLKDCYKFFSNRFQEALLKYSSTHCTEGWCLQYNQHLEKTLLVPVAEPKPSPRSVTEDPMAGSGSLLGTSGHPVFHPEPTIRSSSGKMLPPAGAKRRSFPRGPGDVRIFSSGFLSPVR